MLTLAEILPKHGAIAKVCAAAPSKIADGLTTLIQKPVEG